MSAHATSKIASFDDLERVGTLGFRGEALPSIASVSRFALTSRRSGSDAAWRIEVDGGKPRAPVPAQHPQGTNVEVRDLFYNLPARRKFLRAERTEFNHIDELVKSIALARTHAEFRLSHNGKAVRMLKPALDESDGTRRVADVLGDEFLSRSLRIEHAAAACACMAGSACRPPRARKPTSSISTSTDASCAIVSSRTPCARRMRTCSTTAVIRASFCSSNSIRCWSTSTCIRPSTKCAFAKAAWCTIFSIARSTMRWVAARVPAGVSSAAAAASGREVARRRLRWSIAGRRQRVVLCGLSPGRPWPRRTRAAGRLRGAVRPSACVAAVPGIRRQCPFAADAARRAGDSATRFRARAAAWHLRAGAERARLDPGRHARRTRTHHLREAENRAGTARASVRNCCWCR